MRALAFEAATATVVTVLGLPHGVAAPQPGTIHNSVAEHSASAALSTTYLARVNQLAAEIISIASGPPSADVSTHNYTIDGDLDLHATTIAPNGDTVTVSAQIPADEKEAAGNVSAISEYLRSPDGDNQLTVTLTRYVGLQAMGQSANARELIATNTGSIEVGNGNTIQDPTAARSFIVTTLTLLQAGLSFVRQGQEPQNFWPYLNLQGADSDFAQGSEQIDRAIAGIQASEPLTRTATRTATSGSGPW